MKPHSASPIGIATMLSMAAFTFLLGACGGSGSDSFDVPRAPGETPLPDPDSLYVSWDKFSFATRNEEKGKVTVFSMAEKDLNYMKNKRDSYLEKLNEVRKQAGVKPVREDDALDAYGMVRAIEISGSFKHFRPDGSQPKDHVKNGAFAENILRDKSDDAANAIKLWKNSRQHYFNMTHPKPTRVGLGIYKKGDDFFVVQLLGSESLEVPFRTEVIGGKK